MLQALDSQRHSLGQVPAVGAHSALRLNAVTCPGRPERLQAQFQLRRRCQAAGMRPAALSDEMSWRDRPTEPWGDADRVVVSGNGPMFVNVLESQAAYCVVGEYDPADCEHVEVVLDEEADMLAIQFDAPYASPVQWADVLGNEAAARVHVESPGRFVRWVELNDDADLEGVTARYLRSPVPNTQWPSEAVVIWIAKVTAPEATVRKVELDMRHE